LQRGGLVRPLQAKHCPASQTLTNRPQLAQYRRFSMAETLEGRLTVAGVMSAEKRLGSALFIWQPFRMITALSLYLAGICRTR